jgi:acetylornithine deacetylase/succinyl-diaminopimelate desuccinylase-like protein
VLVKPPFTILMATTCLMAAATSAAAASDPVRAWRERHEAAIVRELADFSALPNLAGDSTGIRRNVAALRDMLERRGVRVEVLENGSWPPAVFGTLPVPGARRTIVFYAHYDGQPVTPSEWTTPPWQPTLRVRDGNGWRTIELPARGATVRLDPDARLFARSTADDKASIVAMLAALDALRESDQRPTVNVAFFFEGEEEAGSAHVRELLERHRDQLGADAWLFCDGPVHASRQPQLVFGARGVMGLELTVYGPARALHSGHYGNWAPNPALLLARVLAGLRDEDGRILVDGFYDDVAPVTATDRAAIAALPDVDSALRRELALNATEGGNAPSAERILLPALNVHGIRSGAVGAQATNAIPVDARASIDIRLVPNQTPAHARELIESHLRRQGWFVTSDSVTIAMRRAHPKVMRITWESGYPAYRVALDAPVARALRATLDEELGHPVAVLPMLGGSLPLATFAEVLHAPLVAVPIANHDDNQHAKDENLRLQNLWDGIDIFAAILTRLDAHWPR